MPAKVKALLYCTRCEAVVAVGPEEDDLAVAAYRLGLEGDGAFKQHIADCQYAAVTVTIGMGDIPVGGTGALIAAEAVSMDDEPLRFPAILPTTSSRS